MATLSLPFEPSAEEETQKTPPDRRPALAAALLLAATGCADTSPTGDSPTGAVDDAPADVINFPNRYANVAHKCDGHGHRVCSTTREAPR